MRYTNALRGPQAALQGNTQLFHQVMLVALVLKTLWSALLPTPESVQPTQLLFTFTLCHFLSKTTDPS